MCAGSASSGVGVSMGAGEKAGAANSDVCCFSRWCAAACAGSLQSSAMNRSMVVLVRLYSGDCLPSFRPERMRSRADSKSSSCWGSCLRDLASSLRRRIPPSAVELPLVHVCLQILSRCQKPFVQMLPRWLRG